MSINYFTRPDSRGFFIMPRRLYDAGIEEEDPVMRIKYRLYGYFLCNACFSQVKYDKNEAPLERGELLVSLRTLSKLFNVSVNFVNKFLKWMQEEKLAIVTPGRGGQKTRVKMLHYDNLCLFPGCNKPKARNKRNKNEEQEIEEVEDF